MKSRSASTSSQRRPADGAGWGANPFHNSCSCRRRRGGNWSKQHQSRMHSCFKPTLGDLDSIAPCNGRWLPKTPLGARAANSLPSGMTMGTSGAAPSAERDPDSLEREDDSLFPCLLELFLSHISPAESPPLFFLSSPPPSQSLTHGPSAASGGDRVGMSGGATELPN